MSGIKVKTAHLLPDWENASCIGLDTETFFPDSRDRSEEIKMMVRGMCTNCVVFSACLDYSLRNKVDGIWAGADETERKQIRKQMGIKPASLLMGYMDAVYSMEANAIAKRKERAKKSYQTQLQNRMEKE
jgi:hypothetical protein